MPGEACIEIVNIAIVPHTDEITSWVRALDIEQTEVVGSFPSETVVKLNASSVFRVPHRSPRRKIIQADRGVQPLFDFADRPIIRFGDKMLKSKRKLRVPRLVS